MFVFPLDDLEAKGFAAIKEAISVKLEQNWQKSVANKSPDLAPDLAKAQAQQRGRRANMGMMLHDPLRQSDNFPDVVGSTLQRRTRQLLTSVYPAEVGDSYRTQCRIKHQWRHTQSGAGREVLDH